MRSAGNSQDGAPPDPGELRLLLERAHACMGSLAAAFPFLAADQVEVACADAALDLASHHPGEEIAGWLLYQAAWRRARALARSERARRAREARWAAEIRGAELSLAAELDTEERYARYLVLAAEVERLLPDEALRPVFRLWLDGERDEAAYTAALGLEGMDRMARQWVVKRQKDRLDKFLERSKPVRAAAERLYEERRGGG